MAKFNFNLKDLKKETTSIRLIIRWNNNRLVYPTKESISPDFWETDKKKRNFQRAKETKKFAEYPELNSRLDKIMQDAKNVFRKFINDNENIQPTVEKLRELLDKHFNKGNIESINDLPTFAGIYIVQVESAKKPSTIKGYKNTLSHLFEYQKHIKKKLTFDKITIDFYLDFTDYLVKEKNFKPNTIGKQIKNLKVFMTAATERGINKNLEYKSRRFKVLSENTEAIYLNEDELNRLYELDLTDIPKYERVRDLFLVGCYTGLRFSDLSQLKKEHINNGYISIKTQKTGGVVDIPVHHIVAKIITKYKQSTVNGLPTAISNQKMNEYLKEIAKKAKLNDVVIMNETTGNLRVEVKHKKFDLVSTHTARRSFATNLYLSGFPTLEIRKITGHKTEQAFLRYIKMEGKESAVRLKEHWSKQT